MGVRKSSHECTIDIYSYGRIGTALKNYAKAFGMTMVWWTSEQGWARLASVGKAVAASRTVFLRNVMWSQYPSV